MISVRTKSPCVQSISVGCFNENNLRFLSPITKLVMYFNLPNDREEIPVNYKSINYSSRQYTIEFSVLRGSIRFGSRIFHHLVLYRSEVLWDILFEIGQFGNEQHTQRPSSIRTIDRNVCSFNLIHQLLCQCLPPR